MTNLLETLDLISSKLAAGECVDLVFLDFLKAFDTVPHRRLLKKLRSYGVSGKLYEWFKSFLFNRRQRVILGDCVSDWSEVKSGVPQGSVLGPLLFVIYINDLPDAVDCECKMYADDSKLISVTLDTSNGIQSDIDAVTSWTKDWLMRLNASKCKVMHLGKNNSRIDYEIEDVSTGERKLIEKTECEKDQGVLIRSDLKWEDQVRYAASKANRVLGMLKKTFMCRDSNLWKKLYISLVRPHLEYAVQVWNPYLAKDIELIEKVQRRAIKIPTNMEAHREDYEGRLEEWGLTKLSVRRVRGDLIQMYKIKAGTEDINWTDGPKYSDSQYPIRIGNSYNLVRNSFTARQRNDFCHFVAVRHNFFSNRVAEHWNKLNDDVVKAPSLTSFKTLLDQVLNKGLL